MNHHDDDRDLFDRLDAVPFSKDPLNELLDLWETPGIGIGQIRDCLDSLAAQRRLAAHCEEPLEPSELAPVPTPKRRSKPFKRISEENLRTMETLRAAGMTFKQIAMKMRLSMTAVCYYLGSGTSHGKVTA